MREYEGYEISFTFSFYSCSNTHYIVSENKGILSRISLKETQSDIPFLISSNVRDTAFDSVRAYIPEYAILGCDKVKLESKFLVDGFVSLKGPYGGSNVTQGSVATNGEFKAESGAIITGKLVLGPQAVRKIDGASVGSLERVTSPIDCPDFSGAFERARFYNDNDRIPGSERWMYNMGTSDRVDHKSSILLAMSCFGLGFSNSSNTFPDAITDS